MGHIGRCVVRPQVVASPLGTWARPLAPPPIPRAVFVILLLLLLFFPLVPDQVAPAVLA